MAEVTLNAGVGGANIATNAITRDATTEHMELINVADPTSGTCAAVDGNGLHVNLTNPVGPGVNATGTGQYMALADASAPISVTSTPSTIVTGVAGKQIFVTHIDFMANFTGTIQFVHGAGNTAITGAYAVTAQTGLSMGNGTGVLFTVAAGDDLKIVTTVSSGSTSIAGLISYSQR